MSGLRGGDGAEEGGSLGMCEIGVGGWDGEAGREEGCAIVVGMLLVLLRLEEGRSWCSHCFSLSASRR